MEIETQTGLHDLSRHLPADRILDVTSDLHHFPEIDPRLDAHFVQHVDQILSADIARCFWREGAATNPSE